MSYTIRKTSKLFLRNIIGSELLQNSPDLTNGRGTVIHFIHSMNQDGKEIYQKDIEKNFNVNRSTASLVLQELENAGYLTKEISKTDKRLKEIKLTDKALEFVCEFDQMIQELNQKALDGFSDEEISKLKDYLGKIISNLTKGDEENAI